MSKIILENVCLDYPIYNSAHNSLRRTIVNLGTGGVIFKNHNDISVVRALDNISINIQQGDKIGLIGHNGSGKSTLLRTIGQFYTPTSGKLLVEGNILPLFSVCTGMDLEKTGYENINLIGKLLNLSNKKIQEITPDIEEFSELSNFLNFPVRTYSDGMKIRLGFSIFTCLEPEILLLDEAIGVSDANFIEKAIKRAKVLYSKANILVIASHSTVIIEEFCNKVLWLNNGKIHMLGNVKDVIREYNNSII